MIDFVNNQKLTIIDFSIGSPSGDWWFVGAGEGKDKVQPRHNQEGDWSNIRGKVRADWN